MTMTDDELDRRMLLADPARGLAPGDDSLGALLSSTGEQARSTRPRSRRRMLTGLGIAGVMLIGGAAAAPAAADAIRQFLAQSDWTCSWGSECGDPAGQWIDTGAADFVDYTATVFPYNLPLPAGVDAEELRVSVAASRHANPALTPDYSIVFSFESRIYCEWVGEWLNRDAVGDIANRDAAARVMKESADWPGLVASDGGGIAEITRALAEAALDGNREAVQAAAQYSACEAWDGHEHPEGDRIASEVMKKLELG